MMLVIRMKTTGDLAQIYTITHARTHVHMHVHNSKSEAPTVLQHSMFNLLCTSQPFLATVYVSSFAILSNIC